MNGESLPPLLLCRRTACATISVSCCFSNVSVQSAVSRSTCAVSSDRGRVVTSTSMFGSRNKRVHISTPAPT